MIEILATGRDGAELKVSSEPKGSLMQALQGVGELGVRADCGGNASCATCHIYVRSDWESVVGAVASDDEQDLLDGLLSATPASRLSCQIHLTQELDGVALTIAPAE